MGVFTSKTPTLVQDKILPSKMKGALLLIGLMVCASMTEASSPRWAKKQVKPITNRHFKTNVAKAHAVSSVTGCGATCDQEFIQAFMSCVSYEYVRNLADFMACLASNFDADCHDCLCNLVFLVTGLSCP